MKYNPDIHNRKSIRLKGYDYSQSGAYFITICTKNRECLFGTIIKDGLGKKFFVPSELGKIVKQCWHEIPKHYPFVILNEFIVMPNHIHGILFLNSNPSVGVQNFEPLQLLGQL